MAEQENRTSNMFTNMRISKSGIVVLVSVCGLILLYMRGMFVPSSIFASTEKHKMICLKELLVASIEAAERGGKMVRDVKEGKNLEVHSKGKTLEGVVDPVTLGDMLSHKIMFYSLAKMWPDLNIVSEEKSDDVPDLNEVKPINLDTAKISESLGSTMHSDARIQDITVWIDPLDATKEYTENLTEYVTTMVCVAHKGQAIIGVIHRPFLKQTIWAWYHHGKSNIPEFQTNQKEVHDSRMKIIVSLSHAGLVKNIATNAFGAGTEIISAGGAGFKALNVAQRKANAYIHTTLIKKWDICAGNALLKTVGGDMTDLKGIEIDYSYPYKNFKTQVKLASGLLATFKDHEKILKKLRSKYSMS